MLSSLAQKKLKSFLLTIEKELGFRPDSIQLWGHNGSEEKADQLQEQYAMERNDFDSHSSVSYQGTSDSTRLEIYYTFAPEEEFEPEPFKCRRCEGEVEENSNDENAELCDSCYDLVLEEWQAEKQHEKSEYIRAVL